MHWNHKSNLSNALTSEIKPFQCTEITDQTFPMHWNQKSNLFNATKSVIKPFQCTEIRNQTFSMQRNQGYTDNEKSHRLIVTVDLK